MKYSTMLWVHSKIMITIQQKEPAQGSKKDLCVVVYLSERGVYMNISRENKNKSSDTDDLSGVSQVSHGRLATKPYKASSTCGSVPRTEAPSPVIGRVLVLIAVFYISY